MTTASPHSPASITLEEAIRAHHSTRAFFYLRPTQHLDLGSRTRPAIPFKLQHPALPPLHRHRPRTRPPCFLLLAAASQASPLIPALPPNFQHFRSNLGQKVYGVGMGIVRPNTTARAAAVLRNYEFFGAPVVGILCMNKELGLADSVSLGMYLQTLCLALTERGLGSCVQVSVAGYPHVLRSELGIADELEILVGIGIEFDDLGFKGNSVNVGRQEIG